MPSQGSSYDTDAKTIYFINQCSEYMHDSIALDPYWKSSASFSIISIIIGFMVVFLACMAPCVIRFQCSKIYGYIFLFVAISNGLTLLFLKSDLCKNNPFVARIPDLIPISDGTSCKLATGAILSIAATVVACIRSCNVLCVGQGTEGFARRGRHGR